MEDVKFDQTESVNSMSVTLDTENMTAGAHLYIYIGGWEANFEIDYDGSVLSRNTSEEKNVSQFMVDGNKVTVTFTSAISPACSWSSDYNNKITFHSNAGTTIVKSFVVNPPTALSASLDMPLQLGAASVAAEEIMPMLGAADDATNTSVDFVNDVATVTLSPTSGPNGEEWTYFVQNLDVYAESGAYYYWVEEVNVQPGGVNTYDISYQFDDADDSTTFVINAAQPGAATATIRNTKTQDESYELPSTGGVGTRWYTIAGLLVLGGGCGGFATTHLIRRFRRRKCTK